MKQHGLILRCALPCSLKPEKIEYKTGIAPIEKTKEDAKISKYVKIYYLMIMMQFQVLHSTPGFHNLRDPNTANLKRRKGNFSNELNQNGLNET